MQIHYKIKQIMSIFTRQTSYCCLRYSLLTFELQQKSFSKRLIIPPSSDVIDLNQKNNSWVNYQICTKLDDHLNYCNGSDSIFVKISIVCFCCCNINDFKSIQKWLYNERVINGWQWAYLFRNKRCLERF